MPIIGCLSQVTSCKRRASTIADASALASQVARMWPIVGGLFLEARQQFSLLGVELLCRQYAGVAELTKLGKLLVNVRLTRGSGLFSRWTVCHRAGKTLPDGVCDVLPVGLVHASDLSLVAGGEDCQGSRQHAGTRTADIL